MNKFLGHGGRSSNEMLTTHSYVRDAAVRSYLDDTMSTLDLESGLFGWRN